ncbi:MAG TPA: hypothetical protein VNK48_03215 [Xanthobacteraceae bacterium]|nr:hypothetical protein [Xanthobacteraceae bacterium]
MGDPLYHDEVQAERMANDPQIVATVARTQRIKAAIGLAALALLAAIWLVWRWE